MAVKAWCSVVSTQAYDHTAKARFEIKLFSIGPESFGYRETNLLTQPYELDSISRDTVHDDIRTMVRDHAENTWNVDFDPGDEVMLLVGLSDQVPA